MMNYLSEEYLNSTPSAAFSWVFGPLLGEGNPNFAKWLRGQEGDWFQDYQGEVANDPNLRLVDYYRRKNPMADFMNLAPRQRGINYSQFQPQVNYRFGIGF